ncbi:MAG: hypothetical protein A2857_04505 [Candidatus Levybacteria bacterium RIFCSPHIGHO2_01_FULL_36_15]|nr:MAG: hypothetical protein A2857_04505 [Candidatus Levybacteria bacterium RIFCSPHIGHO2_01_FULL_36_15]OGH38615.1 MAG: hypothetical protein A2905_03260 [Candidatus Levybacteria bacterium RIFCSPLOWO2_01_FULL_36_10]
MSRVKAPRKLSGNYQSSPCLEQSLSERYTQEASGKLSHYKTTAIVPAYNEEKKIANVLKVLTCSRNLDEVICVNDGSSDKTLSIIKKIKGLKIINLKENHGKAYAISRGIKKAKNDIVVFFDADISGLKDSLIKELIMPLKDEGYDLSVGYRCGKMERTFFKPFGGERAFFRRDLLPHLKKMGRKGYGLELYLNYIFRNKKMKTVHLDGVVNIFKHKKQSYPLAVKLTLRVVFDIFDEILKQENPMSYFLSSCLPFYVKKRRLSGIFIDKYFGIFYENINFLPLTPYSLQKKGISPLRSLAVYSSLTSIMLIISFSVLISSLNLHNKNFEKLALRNVDSYKKSYSKYESLLLSKVWEPVKKTVPLIEIVGIGAKRDYKFTTGFTSV